jgi:hypothetical protein
MSTTITTRLSAGSYVARAKGHKGTASSTISPRMAANGMANKLGLDFTLLRDDGEKDGKRTFTHPQESTL